MPNREVEALIAAIEATNRMRLRVPPSLSELDEVELMAERDERPPEPQQGAGRE